MNKTKFAIAALSLLALGQVQAAVPAAKIQAMLAKPSVMCGRFDQTKNLAGMKKPLAAEGRFCVVAGKGVLWRTLKPFPSTLRLTRDEIVNYQGDRVAMRLDAKTEPTVRVINNVLFSLLAGDLGQLDTLFDGDGSVDANSWTVSLKPRQAALEKAIGTIKLEGGNYVKSIVMSESSGDRTTIVFSAIQTGEGAMSKEEAALF
ncbi:MULTISPECIES: outer membrane lipoprotein carrier protein LolA [unclassified Duganella]|jgi:outer membrane lipoprotein-sorting protein|uniref:outer membrane lipoprotein carrier protein LolA n=1 Tax=unclassified Duganella TaxID=2636909 RepID=UPI00088D4A56|nr:MULTISPECIES: outer membrane lipoprotein carrier protein LolA [unclassified Duganella]SDF41608.1 Outer membrane lipoprotein-sorting protein [Duganella sp. OV458]SDI84991.1 Outer membrane lipoprotein-sorting protein [Duganella sp. OV510]